MKVIDPFNVGLIADEDGETRDTGDEDSLGAWSGVDVGLTVAGTGDVAVPPHDGDEHHSHDSERVLLHADSRGSGFPGGAAA